MNNVYFANEGMTSTTANYYANIAKEFQNAAMERLNNVKFFQTSVAVIGSSEKQLMSAGTTDLSYIKEDLNTVASMNAFCAWVREAIKEKDNQMTQLRHTTIEDWAKSQGIVLATRPEFPRDPEVITEQDVINTWDINKRNKYLRLEAFASTIGKYIHLEGTYNKARKKAHTSLNNPITKEGTGRDMVLYYTEPSVAIADVDALFMNLQDAHRGYEKELNQMKAELKEAVNDLTQKAYQQHQIESDAWREAYDAYNASWSALRTQFNAWKSAETEKLSKLKIAIPETLKETFRFLKEIGDTSK